MKGIEIDNIAFGGPAYNSLVCNCVFCPAPLFARLICAFGWWTNIKQVLSKGDKIIAVDGKPVTVRDFTSFWFLATLMLFTRSRWLPKIFWRVVTFNWQAETVSSCLVGRDIAGSLVSIQVKQSGATAPQVITLTRMATEAMSDRRAMFEIFTSAKNHAKQREDKATASLLDRAIILWTKMLDDDAKHNRRSDGVCKQ